MVSDTDNDGNHFEQETEMVELYTTDDFNYGSPKKRKKTTSHEFSPLNNSSDSEQEQKKDDKQTVKIDTE